MQKLRSPQQRPPSTTVSIAPASPPKQSRQRGKQAGLEMSGEDQALATRFLTVEFGQGVEDDALKPPDPLAPPLLHVLPNTKDRARAGENEKHGGIRGWMHERVEEQMKQGVLEQGAQVIK